MKRTRATLALLIGTLTLACSQPSVRTEDVPLAQLPSAVRMAATAAVPGIQLESAGRGVDDAAVYEVMGVLGGVEYEITVTADGVVRGVDPEPEAYDGSAVGKDDLFDGDTFGGDDD